MDIKPKILLVDDESAITGNLAPFLERAGFETKVAADGEQALMIIKEFKPNLIVLDVLMPKFDGREVLRRLRQSGNLSPIILLTQVGEFVAFIVACKHSLLASVNSFTFTVKVTSPEEAATPVEVVKPGTVPIDQFIVPPDAVPPSDAETKE